LPGAAHGRSWEDRQYRRGAYPAGGSTPCGTEQGRGPLARRAPNGCGYAVQVGHAGECVSGRPFYTYGHGRQKICRFLATFRDAGLAAPPVGSGARIRTCSWSRQDMDSFELNKIAGAVLMALLVVMGVGVMSDIIFTPHHPEQPGFVIAVATEGEGEAAGGEQAQVAPIGARLASATVEAGEKTARKCAACHDFTKGGPNKVGPNLWDVVGRKPGAHEGFKYSA